MNIDGKSCIIEFQAFRNNVGSFIVKELVILDLKTIIPIYFLFKPPFSLQKLCNKSLVTNKWLTHHFHNISWEEGFTEYSELENILLRYCIQYQYIYTTGVEKCSFLKKYTNSDIINCNIKEDKFHYKGICNGVKNVKHNFSNCALTNAYSLRSSIKTMRLTKVEGERGVGDPYYKSSDGEQPGGQHLTPSQEANQTYSEVTMAEQKLQSLVQLFNQHSRSNLLVTRKCSELKENKKYIIHSLKKVDTTVGEGIIAALSESPYKEGDAAKFQIFLPKRFVTLLQNEDLDAVGPGQVYLVSHGPSGNSSTELTIHLL